MHQRRIDAVLGSKAHISAAQCVESDRQTARGRAGQRSQEVGRDRKGDEWASAIDSTQLRTMANASTAATTAPKPTRLATLSIGSTDALAPASPVCRSPSSRFQLTMTTVTIAANSAVTTAHTPPTAESEDAPNRSSARNEK